MGIDLITGKHICFGLAIGEGCDECKAKYPHLLAKTPEEIEAGKRNLQAAIAAYTDDRNGERPQSAEHLNSFAYRRPGADGVTVIQERPDGPCTIEVEGSARLTDESSKGQAKSATTDGGSGKKRPWWKIF